MIALQISPKIESLYGLGRQAKQFARLPFGQFSTLKLDWVAFYSVTYQSKCLDFQSNQYKKLVPVLSLSSLDYGE